MFNEINFPLISLIIVISTLIIYAVIAVVIA